MNAEKTFGILAVCVASLAAAADAVAAEWPNRPITIIVPSGAGGTTDSVARLVAERLSPKLGQPVLVENKPGASGTIGIQTMLREPPDGHSFVIAYPSNLIVSQFTMKDLSFDPKRDLAPLAGLVINEMVMVANASVPANDPRQLVDWARSHSGKSSYGSYGHGSYSHLISHYLGNENQFEALHAAYKGESHLLVALAGNEVSYGIAAAPASRRMQDTGKVRVVGLFAPERSPVYPELPTFKEMGLDNPAFSLLGWAGLFARRETPPDITSRMEAALLEVIGSAEMQERLTAISSRAWHKTAKEVEATWHAEIPIYDKLTTAAGIVAQ